jgi:hypothetical protein
MAHHVQAVSNDAEGVEEWLELMDQALDGLYHALDNRIGSLSALIALLRPRNATADEFRLEGVAAELARLEDCSRLVRLLPRNAVASEEPLILDDVLADAFAIHRFLHELRDVPVTIVPTRFVEPVRVERWALVRVLTLLLSDAKRLARPLDAAVRVVAESDEHWVSVEFRVGAPPVRDVPASGKGRYSERVARSLGATVSRRPGVVELRIPTLKARRAADQMTASHLDRDGRPLAATP